MSTRRDALAKQLSWMPKVWLATREAFRQNAGAPAFTFQRVLPEYLRLPQYLRDLERIDYFSVTYGVRTADRNRSKRAVILDRRLNEAELVRGSCRTSVYVFWHLMIRIMCEDTTLKSIEWKRSNPYPELMLFRAGGDVEPYNHDYFLLSYGDGEEYVVDLTAAQFGWAGWLYTKEEYDQNLMTWLIVPGPVKVEDEIREMEEADWRLELTKYVIERSVEGAEARVLGGEESDVVYGELADQVRTELLEAIARGA
jgi:hypothetical protein